MNEYGKSDKPIVPVKPPNKTTVAEVVEERGLAKGNAAGKTRPGPRAGQDATSALDRVRRMATKDKEARFTALLHHVSAGRLRKAYWALNPRAATGGAGGGARRRDMGRLRAEPGGEPEGSARSGSPRGLSAETVTAGVHSEGGRAAKAAGHCRVGGQDSPTCRRRGA